MQVERDPFGHLEGGHENSSRVRLYPMVTSSSRHKYTKQDAREAMRVVFFCTYKTYLYMYAQNENSYEYIQILF